MESQFELLTKPTLFELPAFRFAHHRVRGPYLPWTRIAAIDSVAEALERAEVDRIGPAFGIYYDLPFPETEAATWTADLGFPISHEAGVPRVPAMRARELPEMEVAGLRYRGDLASFEPALELLVEWLLERELDPQGPLLERFHVSDALTGVEDRDLYVALHHLPT